MKTILGISLFSCHYLNQENAMSFLILLIFYSSIELEKMQNGFCLEARGEGVRVWRRKG
jgi:hypothetical protein